VSETETNAKAETQREREGVKKKCYLSLSHTQDTFPKVLSLSLTQGVSYAGRECVREREIEREREKEREEARRESV